MLHGLSHARLLKRPNSWDVVGPSFFSLCLLYHSIVHQRFSVGLVLAAEAVNFSDAIAAPKQRVRWRPGLQLVMKPSLFGKVGVPEPTHFLSGV